MKYLLVIIIISIQIIIIAFTRCDSFHIQTVNQLLENTQAPLVFTLKGKENIIVSYDCLSYDALRYFQLQGNKRDIANAKYLEALKKILKSFPLHLLRTKQGNSFTEIEVLFNVPQPVTITFILFLENGHYRIENIVNLCELFKRVNLYFENKRKNINGEI